MARVTMALAALLITGCVLGVASAAASTAFSEDWESGLFETHGWIARDTSGAPTTSDPTWQILNNPQNIAVTNPGINPDLVTLPDTGNLPAAHGGVHAAWFGDTSTGTFCGSDWSTVTQSPKNGCTSSQAFSGTLTSPSINLGGATTATLHFFSWWEIESVNADSFDLMQVEYSTDGGQTWSGPIALNPADNPAGTHDQSYSNNGLEVSPSWHEYLVDLSPAAAATNGGSIQVRFVFDTVDNAYNGFRGWLIDDITVNTPSDVPAPAISSVTTCSGTQDAPITTINGSNFVQGSKVVVDGASVPASVTSSQRIEISALTSGTHSVQVVAPNGTTSNTAQAAAGNCALPPPPQPPPPAAPPPPPPSPPSPPSTSAPAPGTGAPSVGGTTAAFTGSVNPGGLPTTAFFQYGLDPKYTGGGPIAYSQSTPAQTVGSDFTTHTVTASVSGLVPNATYHVRLVATNGAGTTFGPDVVFGTLKSPPPSSPPVVGKTFNVSPVSGVVLILINGRLVPLTELQQIPKNALIDALHGTVKLTTSVPGGVGGAHDAAAKGKKHKPKLKTQTGTFGGAIFRISQAGDGLATLALVEGAIPGGPSYGSCKTHKAGDPTATAAASRTLQLLHASAKGKFSTKGRYGAATVRGTKWTTSDRCDGTLIHDITDSVAVTDFVRHKTIILHAGQTYLARKR